MALSQNLVQKQTQKLIITQDLRQSIELLPMSNLELSEKIEKEVLENPMLEIAEDFEKPENPAEGPAPENQRTEGAEEDIGESFPDFAVREEYAPVEGSVSGAERSEKKHQFLQNQVRTEETLADHLLWQVRLLDLDEDEIQAAEIIVSSIDEKGYLTQSLEELASATNLPIDLARRALEQVRRCDPVGCGARTVPECLISQIQILYPAETTAIIILRDHFDSLEKLDFKKIEKAGLPEADIDSALKVIRGLEPYPGTLFSPPRHDYIVPDMSVQEVDGTFEVFVQDEWIPELKINDRYKNLMRKETRVSGEDREYLQSRLNSAAWLIKSIKQRRETMIQVMRSIIRHQKAFFEQGPGHLRPLTLREIAADVELHESTISRITTNKYVQTRWGIFELKHFFSSSLRNSEGGDDHSARNIKDRIARLVSEETDPLSDQEIVHILKKEGVEIARRTVAKYRKILRILPADRRKKLQGLKQKNQPAEKARS
jgi:RNA polymerase sigma-54 factor